MSYFEHDDSHGYNEDIRKFEPTDPAHADLINAVVQELVHNDDFLKRSVNIITNMIQDNVDAKDLPSSLALGRNITCEPNCVAIGINVNANQLSVAFGRNVNDFSSQSVAIGYNVETNSLGSVAIGYSVMTDKGHSTAIGHRCYANGSVGSIAIGWDENVYGSKGIGIGGCSAIHSESGIGIGNSVGVNGIRSIAIGELASIQNNSSNSVAIGNCAKVSANSSNSTVIGASASACSPNSTAIGYAASTSYSADNSTSLGCNAHTSNKNSIQLGDSSNLSSITAKTGITVTSDERDKTDIVQLDDKAIEFLKKIKIIRYVYNNRELYIPDDLTDEEKEKRDKFGLCEYDKEAHAAGTKKRSRVRIGVSAQGTQKALDEVFHDLGYADLVNDNFFDYSPDEIPEGVENQLGVNYEKFIPFLIKGMQEFDKRLTGMEERVN